MLDDVGIPIRLRYESGGTTIERQIDYGTGEFRLKREDGSLVNGGDVDNPGDQILKDAWGESPGYHKEQIKEPFNSGNKVLFVSRLDQYKNIRSHLENTQVQDVFTGNGVRNFEGHLEYAAVEVLEQINKMTLPEFVDLATNYRYNSWGFVKASKNQMEFAGWSTQMNNLRKANPVWHDDINAIVNIGDYRYSQGNVSKMMNDQGGASKVSLDDVTKSMNKDGYDYKEPPAQIVDLGKDGLVTLDHRRLVAAENAGLKSHPAQIVNGADPVQVPGRFLLNANDLSVKSPNTITEVENLIGRKIDLSNSQTFSPLNYKEAVIFRSANQRLKGYPDFPLLGSSKIPEVK